MHRPAAPTAAALASLALLAACGSMWSDEVAPIQRTESITEYEGVTGLAGARIAVVATDEEANEARDAVAAALSDAGLDVVEPEGADLTIDVTLEVLAVDGSAARVLIACADPGEYAARIVAAAHIDTDGMQDARAAAIEAAGTFGAELAEATRARPDGR